MSRGPCVRSFRKALPGAYVEKVEVGSATVQSDLLSTYPGALDRAVETAGYQMTRATAKRV